MYWSQYFDDLKKSLKISDRNRKFQKSAIDIARTESLKSVPRRTSNQDCAGMAERLGNEGKDHNDR